MCTGWNKGATGLVLREMDHGHGRGEGPWVTAERQSGCKGISQGTGVWGPSGWRWDGEADFNTDEVQKERRHATTRQRKERI